jgi:AcrR family transcriptional regulator
VSEHTLTNDRQRSPRVPAPERRDQILDRASELATEAGLGQMTMKRIASRVGFSEAAIYRHFPTKEALLLALMDRLELHLLHPIRAIAEAAGVPPMVRLQQMVQHHLSLVLVRHSLSIQLLAEAAASGDPALLARMRAIMRGYLDVLIRVSKEAMSSGDLAIDIDPAVLAVWLLGGPAAMAIENRLRLDPALERRVEGQLVPAMFHLLTASKGDAR